MKQGTVKFFNKVKNFGFIKTDENGDDIFFHINDVNGGLKELQEGQKVTYRSEKDTKNNKYKAVDVTVI